MIAKCQELRRRPRQPDLRPVGFPAVGAGVLVESDDVRRAVMVALMDQRVFEEERRTGSAEAVFEDAVFVGEGPLPDESALHVEAENITRPKRGPQMFAIGDRRGPCHPALGVEEGWCSPPQPPMPAFAAGVTFKADDVQLSLIASIGGRQK